MTTSLETTQTLTSDELSRATGGGIGATIGGLFGAKGAKWGSLFDNVLASFVGAGGAAPAVSAGAAQG